MQFVVWALDMMHVHVAAAAEGGLCLVWSGVELKRWLPGWIPAASDPWS